MSTRKCKRLHIVATKYVPHARYVVGVRDGCAGYKKSCNNGFVSTICDVSDSSAVSAKCFNRFTRSSSGVGVGCFGVGCSGTRSGVGFSGTDFSGTDSGFGSGFGFSAGFGVSAARKSSFFFSVFTGGVVGCFVGSPID